MPPKATKKLTAGTPRQLASKINDRKSSLYESIKTVPDLVNLVNSAACELGVDLDRRPSTEDDELFQDAPVQDSSTTSIASRSSPVEAFEEVTSKESKPCENPWLEPTPQHLTELSGARMQLTDEFNKVAEDSGVPVQKCRSESGPNSAQQILSKESAALPRKFSRLRNKSVDSVAEEIHRMNDQQINERYLSRVFTRMWTHPRRMSPTTQGLSDIEERPPEEVQGWLGVAKSELPAAIDPTTTMHKTLPTLDLETSYEELNEQPECEQGCESEAEYAQEPYTLHKDCTPQHRSDTKPLVELQNHIPDPENLLQKQSVQPASADYEVTSLKPLERAINWHTVEFERPVESMAEQEPEDEMELGSETFKPVTIHQTKSSLSRKPSIDSQHAGNQTPFSSSSSEL